jgi:hypothetical protein
MNLARLSQSAAPGDELLEAVLGSLAKATDAAGSGIPTRLQLMHRFDKVSSVAGELVLVPEGRGGIVATLLSQLAGNLPQL